MISCAERCIRWFIPRSPVATTHALLTRLFLLPISRPPSRRWDGCLRGFAQENESISKLARANDLRTAASAKSPLYLDSKVRAQRAFCYDINCRLSYANYLSICIQAVPSIMIVDFAYLSPIFWRSQYIQFLRSTCDLLRHRSSYSRRLHSLK